MGQPAVTEYTGRWLQPGRARFWRTVLMQRWELTVEPSDYITVTQAAILIGVTDQIVAAWIRDELIDPNYLIQEDASGAVLMPITLAYEIWHYRHQNGEVESRWLRELSGTALA